MKAIFIAFVDKFSDTMALEEELEQNNNPNLAIYPQNHLGIYKKHKKNIFSILINELSINYYRTTVNQDWLKLWINL